jgi:hypothetical protein
LIKENIARKIESERHKMYFANDNERISNLTRQIGKIFKLIYKAKSKNNAQVVNN